MIASHVHDALSQVRKLQTMVLEKRNFVGYSGLTRITGGTIALIGSIVLSSNQIPTTPEAHLIGWGAVLFFALAANYAGLFSWFFLSPDIKRDLNNLLPAIDAIPALVVGAIISVGLVIHHQYQFLVGIWMCMYGLAHMSYRLTLPKSNYLVGLFYIFCGSICFFCFSFLNPWPMGIVFFVGELAGGISLHFNRYHRGQNNGKNRQYL